MQLKPQRNILSGNPSKAAKFAFGQYPEELLFSRRRELPSAYWLLQQWQEAATKIDDQTIESFTDEISTLRDEMKKLINLLSISNDLLLQLNENLKIQESQSYFWTDAWLEGEHQADEDIKNNNVHTFETADKIVEFLRKSE